MYTIIATRYQDGNATHIIRYHADDSWWIVRDVDLRLLDSGEIPTDEWLTPYDGDW